MADPADRTTSGSREEAPDQDPRQPLDPADVADLPGLVPVLPVGAIPALDDPAFVEADAADPDMDDEEMVVAVEVAGDARAYPVRILDWHEIVNDAVGGRPVAVTWCPLCGTGLAFDRTVDDRTLTFRVSGSLYKNDLVMVDRETGTHWVQLEGRALAGDLKGRRLEPHPTDLVPWAAWRELHPDGRVLVPPKEPGRYGRDAIDYAHDPHPGYAEDHGDIRFPVEHLDDRLPAKAVVAGRLPDATGGPAVAYPLEDLPDPGIAVDAEARLLLVRVGGAVRGFEVGDRAARAEGQTATEETEGSEATSGTVWTLDGRDLVAPDGTRFDALTGRPREGSPASGTAPALAPADLRRAYWFGWADFHPDTEVRRPAARTNA